MDLKVIEPVQKPLKEFDNPDEFNIYYHKHKDDIDEQTTHMLNRKYKINGYRITKIKGVLCLKKEGKNYYKIHKQQQECDESNEKSCLEDRINELEQRMNEIIDYINNAVSKS